MNVSWKWIPAVAMAALTVAGAPSLRAQESAAAGKVQTVEISPNHIQAKVGEKIKFTVVAKDASGHAVDEKSPTWFAAPFDLAGADEEGVVIFHQPGEVTVGAVVGGKTGYARVTVGSPPVTKVDVVATTDALPVGGEAVIVATPRLANGDPRNDAAVQWTSKSPGVAKVNANGMVTGVAPGTATIGAASGSASGEVQVKVVADHVKAISIDPPTASAKTGDVVRFKAVATNETGASTKDLLESWTVSGPGATIFRDGAFVAEDPGTYEVSAMIGRHRAVASITITPRNAERGVEVVAHIPTKGSDGAPIQTSEEWIIGSHLYVATISDMVYVYDISSPGNPKPAGTMKADARLINDISTTPDEKVGIFTREDASTRKNGVVFFDPSNLKVLSEYTETVTGGVHSAYLNTHYAYITDDATGSLRIIDFQDPQHPKEVARWQTESATATTISGPFGPMSSGRYLHDLCVKDGLAYLAYWRDGFIILDVGNGIKGGSPEHPQLVAQYKFNFFELYGNGWLAGTHTTFRYKNYVFVGDEVFPAMFEIDSKNRIPVRGILHVMDVSDIEHPRQVATYEVPEGGMHNVWADHDMLFAGDYNGGGRIVDISGELRGNLYRQGREIARLWTGDPNGFRPNLPFTWGAQPVGDLIYYNDINSGIWIARIGKGEFKGSTTAPGLQVKSE